MKAKKSIIYRPQKLIPGSSIEPGLTGFYAAIPDKNFKGKPFKVIFTDTRLDENNVPKVSLYVKEVESWLKAEKFRRFPDKWGRGVYTLGYFKMCEKL